MNSIFARRFFAFVLSLLSTFGAATAVAQTTVTGRLVAAAHDPAPGQGQPWMSYHVINAAGVATSVDIDDALLANSGGLTQLRGRTVTITGAPAVIRRARQAPENGIRAQSLVARTLGAVSASSFNSGTVPFAALMCRFVDYAGETPAPPSAVSAWIGAAPPGASNFWTETSNGNLTLTGSDVFGWFTMTQSYDYYYGPDIGSRFANTYVRDLALRDDCVNAADATVNFANYKGVVIQLNRDMGYSYAYLDGITMTRDGSTKNFNTAFMASWATLVSGPGVYAHELGHTFGLEHSSGPYVGTYDSKWDVMSYSYINEFASPHGYFGTHTIAYNKYILGWIPANQRKVFNTGDVGTIAIGKSAMPSPTGILYAEVPMLGTNGQKITIEARKRVGLYEAGLPYEGIVLHRFDPLRSGGYGRLLTVVDVDGNGDPNDENAVWTVGEKFTELLSGVQVEVLSENAAGYTVRVSPGRMLTVQFTGAGSGTVVSDASPGWPISCTSTEGVASGNCVRPFYTAQTLTLRATAAPGSRHAGWTGGCISIAESVCKVAMIDARNVTAHFDPVGTVATHLALTTQPRDAFSGKVFSIAPIVQLRDVYGVQFAQAGVRVDALIQSGTGTLSGTTNVLTDATGTAVFANLKITGEGPHTLRFAAGVIDGINSASFMVTAAPIPLLTIMGTGFGVVASTPTGVNCILAAGVGSGTCTKTFAEGTPVTLGVTASAGYSFAGWGGACTSIGACVVSMDTARTVTAAFAPIPYSITASAQPVIGGTVSGGGTFTYGNTASLVATPSPGWHLVQWSEGATAVSTLSPYAFNVTGPRALTATFAQTQRPITITATGSGKIVSDPPGIDCTIANAVPTGSCIGQFFSGASVTLSATAANGFSMMGWSGACTLNGTCVVQVADQPVAVAATFANNNVVVQLTGDGEGRVTSAVGGIDCSRRGSATTGRCETAVVANTEVSLTAVPASGTLFVGWTNACTGFVVCKTTVSAANPTANVSAQFATVPTILPALAASDLLGANSLSELQRTALDRWGNNDGVYDVGDLLAQLDRTQQHLSSSVMRDLLALPARNPQPSTTKKPGVEQ